MGVIRHAEHDFGINFVQIDQEINISAILYILMPKFRNFNARFHKNPQMDEKMHQFC